MRRRLPVPGDVRAAIADVRRAVEASSRPLPASVTSREWRRAEHGGCSFCGEEGPVVTCGDVSICDRSLVELALSASLPKGPHVDQILAIVEKWMAPVPGETPPDPWTAVAANCATCGRPASDLPALVGSKDLAICSDCIGRAAPLADEMTRVQIEAGEAEDALREIDDVERLQTAQGRTSLRANPSLALSLVRLLSTHDERVHERLATLVLALDA